MATSPITKIREKAGITQKSLAATLDVSVSNLSRMERGESDIERDREIYEQLAELVDLEVDELIKKQEQFKEEKRKQEIKETEEKLKTLDLGDEF